MIRFTSMTTSDMLLADAVITVSSPSSNWPSLDRSVTSNMSDSDSGLAHRGCTHEPLLWGVAVLGTEPKAGAEVLVDRETGQVRVTRFVQAQDVGTAINPMGVEGQLDGGAVQGIGRALSEELIIDPDTGQVQQVLGDPVSISGFRLVNARASYGIGLSTMALGFPVHFDWAWPTMFNKEWEDAVFAAEAALEGVSSGSAVFRKVRFQMWIGFDF